MFHDDDGRSFPKQSVEGLNFTGDVFRMKPEVGSSMRKRESFTSFEEVAGDLHPLAPHWRGSSGSGQP